MSLLNPVNPSAGGVPLPEDHREIEAALRAGRISYRLFPYLAWRYKERGEKFTRSDSNWLAWLTRHDQDHIDEQIDWLVNVLSNRGMPSRILELHLRVLARQLIRRVPEKKDNYQRLVKTADRLSVSATKALSEERAGQLVAEFLDSPGIDSTCLPARQAGFLMVAALADEKLGVKNAVSSVEPWLTDLPQLRAISGVRARLNGAQLEQFDSDAFADRWQDALQEMIRQGRRS